MSKATRNRKAILTGLLADALVGTLLTLPASSAEAAPLEVLPGKTIQLGPGVHRFDSVTISGGGTLTLLGDATFIVTGAWVLENTGSVVLATGQDGAVGAAGADGISGSNGTEAFRVGLPASQAGQPGEGGGNAVPLVTTLRINAGGDIVLDGSFVGD